MNIRSGVFQYMDNYLKNKTILCVDDEPGVLDTYRTILEEGKGQGTSLQDLLSARQRRRTAGTKGAFAEQEKIQTKPSFRVLTASSGEEALEIVQHEISCDRRIAVGFFDMLMPGGIDGQETISRIRALDGQILCAVVTAYTDHSTMQIGEIFESQEDWLYFNKPFTMGELSQAAFHLVSAWNRRRREEVLVSQLEAVREDLFGILNFVHDLNKVPPMLLDPLLRGVLEHFLRLLDGRDGFVQLGDQHQSKMIIGAGCFGKITVDTLSTMKSQWDFVGKAMHSRSPMIQGDMAAAPLQVGNIIQGVLFAQRSGGVQQDLKMLEMFASQAVNMIRNSQMYQELHNTNIQLTATLDELQQTTGQLVQSEELRAQYEKLTYYDGLTGLPNRRYLEVYFTQTLSHCLRQQCSIACLMIDVDNFKVINDTLGHTMGDLILQEIGRVLSEDKRGHEFISRYGGEEFVMLLEDISPENAMKVGQRIRGEVEDHTFNAKGEPLKITISIGVAVLMPTVTTTLTEIIDKADSALYEAKNRGKNCCVLASVE